MILKAVSWCRGSSSLLLPPLGCAKLVDFRLVLVCLLIGLAGILSGCGRKAKPESAPPPPAAEAQAPAQPAAGPPVVQAPAQPKTLAVPQGAGSEVVLQQMNRELVRWIVGHRRAPASFEEFVASAQLSVPPPPPGKRYVLGKDMKVTLK